MNMRAFGLNFESTDKCLPAIHLSRGTVLVETIAGNSKIYYPYPAGYISQEWVFIKPDGSYDSNILKNANIKYWCDGVFY